MDLEASGCIVASIHPFAVMSLVVTMVHSWQCPISSRVILSGMVCSGRRGQLVLPCLWKLGYVL